MLKDTMKDYVNNMKEVESEIIAYALTEGAFDKMNDREGIMILKLMDLLHTSYKIVVEEAEALDNINTKLDKLIDKK